MSTLDGGRGMLESYATAMQLTAELLDDQFTKAVELLTSLDSLLIVTGLGKSGLIAQKASATFNSTGTRSVFVHPVEALHGDLGIVHKGTSMLAISKSGGNEETLEFVRQFKNVTGEPVISLSEPESKLAEISEIALVIPKLPEIDQWDLAPTISSSTSMAICDTLAIAVQQAKGFTAEDFAQFHPSGTLGRRLLLSVGDLMLKGSDLPLISSDAKLSEVLYQISAKKQGLAILVRDDGVYFGTITDGDLRRLTERNEFDLQLSGEECVALSRRGTDLPHVQSGSTTTSTKAFDCLLQMKSAQITSLVVLEDNKVIGLIRMQDLVAAGL